jgi:hypothetical protein
MQDLWIAVDQVVWIEVPVLRQNFSTAAETIPAIACFTTSMKCITCGNTLDGNSHW